MDITEKYDRTVREVQYDVEGADEPLACGTERQPRRFVVRRVTIRWINGKRDIVMLGGPRLLKNGEESLSWDGVNRWIGENSREQHLIPAWVLELIELAETREKVGV